MGQNLKPNYGKWRAITLSAVYLLIGLHIAHWKIAGRTLAPLEFNEVLYTIHLGIVTAGFLFMAVTVVATLVVGRFFCSWMCHMVALQDASAWLLQKLNIKPKHFRSRFLLWIPLLAVIYLFILPQIERIYLGQPPVQFRILQDSDGWASFVTTNFWRNLPGLGVTLLTFFLCGSSIVYFLGSRSFCQYGCPYGAAFSLVDRVAPGKIVLHGNCDQCGICTTVCQSHIQVHKEVEKFGKVVNSNCLKDLDCVQACPSDALKFGFTRPAFFQSLSSVTKTRKQYDFTFSEDVILGVCFFLFVIIFRGLYDTIPFLLALAAGITGSYFVVVFLQMLRLEFVRTGPLVLKQSGRFTSEGKIFSGLFFIFILFSSHSAWIHYHQYRGDTYYNQVAWSNKETQTTGNQTLQLDNARYHLELADRYGIYHPASLARELAAIYLLKDEKSTAKVQLENLLRDLPDDAEARLRYAKLLFVSGNESGAMENLKKVTDLPVSTDHDKKIKSDALLMLGHLEEKNGFESSALDRYRQALQINGTNEEATLAMGVLLARTNHLQEAESYLTKSSLYFPNSPLVENNLAAIYMRMHKYALAESHLENLLLLQPGNIQAEYNLAMMKYASGKTSEAKSLLEEIIKIKPDYKQARDAYDMMLNDKYPKSTMENNSVKKESYSLVNSKI